MENTHLQMILPHRLSTQPAQEVTSFDQIRTEAYAMLDMLDEGIKRDGKWVGAIALHHAQVNATPFNFFVVNKGMRDYFNGRRIIINPKILDQSELVPFEEGCLSFPNGGYIKTRRFAHIKVEYQYPKGDGELKFPQIHEFDDFPAFAFQHEFDHGRGKNIHAEFAEYNRPVSLDKGVKPITAPN